MMTAPCCHCMALQVHSTSVWAHTLSSASGWRDNPYKYPAKAILEFYTQTQMLGNAHLSVCLW